MGYIGFSMSEGATSARAEGKMPASDFARWLRQWPKYRGVSALDIRRVLRPAEWHHTSCRFRETDFYDPRDLLDERMRKDIRRARDLRREYDRLARTSRQAGETDVPSPSLDHSRGEWLPQGEPLRWLAECCDILRSRLDVA